jgi:hypothetical protein
LIKEFPGFQYQALVRSESNFEAVSAVGAIPVHGSFSDLDTVTELAAQADIVINAGDSDTIELTEAILRGMRARRDAGHTVGILIHTSGTAVFLEGTDGKFDASAKVRRVRWLRCLFESLGLICLQDSSEDVIKAISTSMSHGQVDVP